MFRIASICIDSGGATLEKPPNRGQKPNLSFLLTTPEDIGALKERTAKAPPKKVTQSSPRTRKRTNDNICLRKR